MGSLRSGHQATPTRARLPPRAGYVLALAVLLGSLVLVLGTWHVVRERELRAAEARFGARAAELVERLYQRLVYYELVARGGTALFASMSRPTPRQWADYVAGMKLQERFPAVTGLGYAGHVPGQHLDDLQLEWRDAGYGQLSVRPHGVRAAYAPVLYLEPRNAGNVAAIGFDMRAHPAMSASMRAAADTGAARLSGAVHESFQSSPGLMLFLPAFRNGDRPRSAAAREAMLNGWVFVALDLERDITASLGTNNADVQLHIVDLADGTRLFSSRRDEAKPAFRHQATISVYGRQWRVEFDSAPEAGAAPRVKALEGTLALGILASLLLYGIAWTLARTEDRAKAIALRMTEDYRRSEQRFRTSMQYSAIGKALLDSEGRIVEANPALGRIVGCSPEALANVRFETLFDAGGQEDDERAADPSGILRVTRQLRRNGDLPRKVQLSHVPVPGNVGEAVAALVEVEDITDRVRAQARVQALNRTLESRVALRTRELSQANRELESFAYSVSHDLRAPLRAIDGFSRVLEERYAGQLDAPGRDYLGRVRRAASRMDALIGAILQISRLSRAELRREPVDLSTLAVELLDELRAADRARNVAIRIAPGLRAFGDAALLHTMLGNLLGNAWKFTRGREQALIEFGSVERGAEREFYVRDNGAGFAQDYVEKLFRPFQRLHAEEQFAGHGIGLASVKRIIERHGGRVRAEGREGEGAVFYFTLPEGGEPAADGREAG